jgi:hypothetical protein
MSLLKAATLLRPYAESEAGPITVRDAPLVGASSSSNAANERVNRLEGSPTFSGYERQRAKILGEYLALRGTLHPLVRRFREEAFGGGTLTSNEAHELVASPAANRLPLSRFEKDDVPLIGHNAHFYHHGVVLKKGNLSKFIEFEYIYVDPPGKLIRVHLPVSVAYEDLAWLWFLSEADHSSENDGYSSVLRELDSVPTPVYPGSVLDNLRLLSLRLVEEYGYCWNESQAGWFVLTGDAVAPKAITATHHGYYSEHITHGAITLRVEPWVPASTVVKVYQYLQGNMLGQKPRAPGARNLAVFEYMIKQSRKSLQDSSQGEVPNEVSWSTVMERWNHNNPAQAYKTKSKFRRDFHRGAQAVIHPYDETGLFSDLTLSIP